MKRKNIKELLPIIKAFAEGKQIQFFNGSAWINLEYPTFNEESRLYRIKIGTMPIKLSEYELDSLLINTTNKYVISYNFFIKDEEDENGNKIK